MSIKEGMDTVLPVAVPCLLQQNSGIMYQCEREFYASLRGGDLLGRLNLQ